MVTLPMTNPSQPESEYWIDTHHAFSAGTLVGFIARYADGDLGAARPIVDKDGDYTDHVIVQINGREYDLHITPHFEHLIQEDRA